MPRYEGFNGMFCGWTAAVALAAICRDGEAGRVPTALSVNYIAPIPAGVLVRIATRCVGSGRSVSHWSAELSGGDGDEVMATAMAVFAVRRPTDGHMQVTMPSAQRPEQITEWHPPMPVGELVDVRPVHGFPPFGRMDADSSEWVRETSGRPGDRMQLAFLADACAPRPAFWSERPRPSATLAMTIYFHATDDELAAVGNDYVLNEVTGARVTRPSLTSHCGCGADSGCCSHQASSCARTGRRQSRPSRSVAAGRGSTQPATRSRLGSFCAAAGSVARRVLHAYEHSRQPRDFVVARALRSRAARVVSTQQRGGRASRRLVGDVERRYRLSTPDTTRPGLRHAALERAAVRVRRGA